MPKDSDARRLRQVRHIRLRRKVSGTPQRPRLCVFRSLNHIYAQVIDDVAGRTLASASSLEPEMRPSTDGVPKAEVSKLVGAAIARKAREAGATKVVFDRGGYTYHGRVKALADAAREGGLEF
jgi:large subunit ribosomal protein L18